MRYLKITLSGTVLFLVYLWVTVMFNSCNSKPAINDSQSTELLDEEMEGVDYTESEAEFEGGDDEDYDAKPESDDDEMNEMEEDDDYEAGDYTSNESTNEREFPVAKPSKSEGNTSLTPRKKRSTSSNNDVNPYESGSSSGQYLVIAGSYLLEDNAKRMVNKLQGMGFSNAEIVYFDQSQYHSICAGKYDSKSSASKTAGSLKSNGIDSYVHRRQ